MEMTSKATSTDLAILETMQLIGTFAAAKYEYEQLVPVTVRGSTIDKSNDTGVCLYWSDTFVLSQSWTHFKHLMTQAFPALFQSKPSQSQHSKKEAVLANLRLYQRRGFTYEESLAFEKRKLLGRLCEQTLDVLTTGMNEIRAGQKEPSDDCLKKMARLDEDKEGVYAVLKT